MRTFWITALVIFVVDQATKLAIVHGMNLRLRGEIDVFPPYLVFRMAWNRGINFGLFSGDSDITRWILIAIALAISAWVVWWMRGERENWKAQVAGGMLVGGALGNVVDRVVYGYLAGKVEGIPYGAVADFLNMSCCGIENPYAFNVADIAIFAGALGLVFFSSHEPKGGKPARSKK
jgi:signal peptidase II